MINIDRHQTAVLNTSLVIPTTATIGSMVVNAIDSRLGQGAREVLLRSDSQLPSPVREREREREIMYKELPLVYSKRKRKV